jgi:hypothetical protein
MTDLNDDLSDLIGTRPTNSAPKALPAAYAHIRAHEFAETCPKCRGTGKFTSYSGRVLGDCFACKGRGSQTFKTAPAVRQQATDRRQAQPQRRWEAFAAAHPAEAAWIVSTTFDFAVAMKQAVEKYGELTERQLATVQRLAAKAAERTAGRAAQAAQQQEQVKSIDVANIVDCFQRAREAGLKRFTLRFDGCHFQVDRNTTTIWVSESGYGTAKFGRIVDGVYKPGRDTTPEVIAKVAEISKDPMAAASAYAQITSSCSVCGKHLENQDSVDAGIGPVCAGRINRPGLKFVPVAKGEF